MTGDEGHRARDVAVGERDLQRCRGSRGGGDAGDDFDRDAGGAQDVDLLAAATEHERIAALEPHHRPARAVHARRSGR